MQPKITVYIPVYNGANYIERALDSILNQTYKDIFLTVSDNCSTDNTVSIVNNYLFDERVKLIKQPCNVGALKNFNDGLDLIKTEYFMFLSHDDCFYDDRALEMGIEILENNKNIPAVYSYMMFIDDQSRPIMQNRYKSKFKNITSGDFVAKQSIISCRNLYGIPLLIRTSVIKDIRLAEGFDHTSDVDFSISISQGKQIYYIPETLLAIRFHKENRTARNYTKFFEEFKRLAIKHNFQLSRMELLQMNLNNVITMLQKYLFYFYLDKIRR